MKEEEIKLKLLDLERKLNSNKNYNIKNKKCNIPIMIIIELLVGIIVGSAIGHIIDDWFETFPGFAILFAVLGFFASLLNIYKNLYTKRLRWP